MLDRMTLQRLENMMLVQCRLGPLKSKTKGRKHRLHIEWTWKPTCMLVLNPFEGSDFVGGRAGCGSENAKENRTRLQCASVRA